jgi:hypothetical protein
VIHCGTNSHGARAWFDLDNGVFGVTSDFGAGFVTAGTLVTEISAGVFRVSLQVQSTGHTLAAVKVGPAGGNGTSSSPVDASVIAGRMQLEVGTVATDYQETPRDTDRRFPSLLLEAAATNTFFHSADFSNAIWGNEGTPIVATNVAVAPDGTTSADSIEDDSVLSPNEGKRQGQAISTSVLPWAFSVYVKKAIGTPVVGVRIALTGGVTDDTQVAFDPETGRGILNTGKGFVVSEDGDYWRVTALADNDGGNSTAFGYCYPAWRNDLASGGNDITATGTNIFWGATMEQAETPSSYIPTSGVAVTRAADSFIAPFPHPPGEMTVYGRIPFDPLDRSVQALYFFIGESLTLNNFQFRRNFGQFSVLHAGPTGASVQSVATITVPVFVPVEYVARLHKDGSVSGVVIADGVTFTLDRTASLDFGPAFDEPLIHIGARPGGSSLISSAQHLAIKGHRGIHSLEVMRAL